MTDALIRALRFCVIGILQLTSAGAAFAVTQAFAQTWWTVWAAMFSLVVIVDVILMRKRLVTFASTVGGAIFGGLFCSLWFYIFDAAAEWAQWGGWSFIGAFLHPITGDDVLKWLMPVATLVLAALVSASFAGDVVTERARRTT